MATFARELHPQLQKDYTQESKFTRHRSEKSGNLKMDFVCDAHCHPACPSLRSQIESILRDAANAHIEYIVGVTERCILLFVLSSEDEDAVALLDMAARYPQILPCIGLHPWYVHEEDLDSMIKLIEDNHEKIVGVGEIGLDFAQSILSQAEVLNVWLIRQ